MVKKHWETKQKDWDVGGGPSKDPPWIRVEVRRQDVFLRDTRQLAEANPHWRLMPGTVVSSFQLLLLSPNFQVKVVEFHSHIHN